MGFFLIFFILLAVCCVVYSLLLFRRKSAAKVHSENWLFKKENDHIYFSYKDVPFTCDCDYGGDGDGLDRRFIVKTIHIRLKAHPSVLAGWTKNDLYDIEHRLLSHFPEADIVWNDPMNTLIYEEK